MISYEEAILAIATLPLGLFAKGRATQRPLEECLGQILAAPVRMERDQPPFDRATMDGYAMRPKEGAERFRIVGERAAGSLLGKAPEPGEAIRIMTGAACPPEVGIVPIERCEVSGEFVRGLDGPAKVGQNIAARGEDARAGAEILPAGTRLDALLLSAAAMAGAKSLSVVRPPKVVLLTTGDEVGQSGEAGIADSNGPLLLGLASSLGLDVTRAHVSDDPLALEAEIARRSQDHDLLVTTGGVSAGDRDFVPIALTAAGFRTLFHKVAIQPGKPVLVAHRLADRRVAVALPGNPVSVLATWHLILWPVLERLLFGQTPTWFSLPLAEDFERRGARRLFLPARLSDGGLVPIAWNGSGDLLAAASGDGLVDFPAPGHYPAGQRLRFLPYATGILGRRPPLSRPLS